MSFPLKIWPREQNKSSQSAKDRRIAEAGLTQDMSTTGCYFSVSRALAVGSKIAMEIQMPPLEGIPEGTTLRCHGTVVRVERGKAPGSVGIGCKIDHYWQARQGARPRKIRVA
ncbi:MAG: PilZ domain-containing protein [Acidobacteria bacterium]|nr:PilZ domain-containing protein [Acidobacteriota bacterium]